VLCDRGYVQDLVRLYDLLVAFALHTGACFSDCTCLRATTVTSLRVDLRSCKTSCSCETRLLLFISLDIYSAIKHNTIITTPY
jgi:hypothetical protein